MLLTWRITMLVSATKNMGKYQEAIDYLKKFDSDDKIVANVALGSIADCYAELKDNDKAIKYYQLAAKNVKNEFTSPVYFMRAGLLLEEKGDFKKSVGGLRNRSEGIF